MQALEFCNGKINMSLSVINEEIRKMLPVLIKNGIIEQCEAGDSILPEQEYRLYPSRYIRTAHWSVTGRCNYRCKHCYMSAPDAKFGKLSHSQVMNIADQIAQCGIREVLLTGGEPLVRKDFMDIADRLTDGGVHLRTRPSCYLYLGRGEMSAVYGTVGNGYTV